MKKGYLLIAWFCLIIQYSYSQFSTSNPSPKLRAATVAGQFYSSDSAELSRNLQLLFRKAASRQTENIRALICPHAGYVFSGEVAASSYSQLDRNNTYENIFIIGTSHRVDFKGASVYNCGNYITPLGEVPVNTQLADELLQKNEIFTYNPQADASEHSIEVQLPFLQYYLKKPFRILPIVIGSQTTTDCKTIAEALRPYFNEKNLFVISTDFSHYPDSKNAGTIDSLTANAIIKNSPEALTETINAIGRKNIPHLITNLCGWNVVLTLLYLTYDNPEIQVKPIIYKNSGDSPYGDKNKVVGYFSLAFEGKKLQNIFTLSNKDKYDCITIARKTLEEYLQKGKIPAFANDTLSETLNKTGGVFVTLKEWGSLRGCIGVFSSEKPIYQTVSEMAIAAAVSDYRFPGVNEDELGAITIEISLISPLHKIFSPEEIILGKHGIYIVKGSDSGTFLPQIAIEEGWNTEEFLGHCARDKAGISWDEWKDAEIYTFEAQVFSEEKK
ncbi:MAG: AmmeMemoRadiSam system protein B [Lentimicrobiaceae bacterium]|nr:AmmeMemoRadiSam system protein B [Lentimicrobiaceae bacterium]